METQEQLHQDQDNIIFLIMQIISRNLAQRLGFHHPNDLLYQKLQKINPDLEPTLQTIRSLWAQATDLVPLNVLTLISLRLVEIQDQELILQKMTWDTAINVEHQ